MNVPMNIWVVSNLLFLFYYYIYLLLFFKFYLFLAVLGLRCCTWAFCSWGEQGLLFIVMRGFLTVVASLTS